MLYKISAVVMRPVSLCALVASLYWCAPSVVQAADEQALEQAAGNQASVQEMRQYAQNFLLKDVQESGALFPGDRFTLGITAVILGSLSSGPQAMTLEDARIAKALAWLLSHQQPDGGIYEPHEGLGNYVTSLTLIALANLGKDTDEQYVALVKRAQAYLLGIQNVEEGSKFNGGIGYGSKGPGHEDLNNTTYAITALRETGIADDHPAMKRALAFVQRCQNHSATNELSSAGNDGGAFYSPDVSKVKSFGTAEDKAQEEQEAAGGQLKSYGTMTYNLIASYIYLNVAMDDARLTAAVNWGLAHYQFETNPGMKGKQAQQGLYYYYLMLAKTFSGMHTDELTLPNGKTVNWKSDLLLAIQARTQVVTLKDGSKGLWWVNESDRWAEGVPHLVTAYVLGCLNYMDVNE